MFASARLSNARITGGQKSRSNFVIALCIQVAAGSGVIVGQSRGFAAAEAAGQDHIGPARHGSNCGYRAAAIWGTYPGLDKRVEQLAGIVDTLAAESMKKYGRDWILQCFPRRR